MFNAPHLTRCGLCVLYSGYWQFR